MPGHKLGRGIPGEFLEDLLYLDVTEIPGTENLHFPEGAIREV
jgi:arginine decarboxylase